MVEPSKLFGRLGNSLFQYAFCYAYAKDHDTDFYFQDPKYFDKYRKEIRRLFGEGIVPIDKVAIHVRRGDYVNNPFHVDLTETDYYERAMALFPDDTFIVFSDDKDWCYNKWGNDPRVEISYENEIDDLNAMAGCKGIIMANSSFSWWASYLSNAKVIAPKQWYGDGLERTKLLPEWTRI